MDEQGFDFQRPPERRAPKKFEPPPWEQDAFAQLERRKVEEERAAAEAAAAEARAAEIAAQVEPAPGGEWQQAGVTASPPEPAVSQAVAAAEQQPGGGEDVDAVATRMLAELAAEEPPAKTSYFGVALGTGIGLGALGAVLVIWGIAAIARSGETGQIGYLGGAALGLAGMFFIGLAVWLVYRTLKQRGVL